MMSVVWSGISDSCRTRFDSSMSESVRLVIQGTIGVLTGDVLASKCQTCCSIAGRGGRKVKMH